MFIRKITSRNQRFLYNNIKQNFNQHIAYFATYLKSFEIVFEILFKNIFKNNFLNKLRLKLYNYVVINNTLTTRKICETKIITNKQILNKRKNFNIINSNQRNSKMYKR